MPEFNPRSGAGFPKSARILHSTDFRRVYDHGARHTCSLFVAFVLREEREGGLRVGYTVPRAFGKAVARNRVRRRMREALRVRLDTVTGPWSIVINPRRAALEAPFTDLEREVERLLRKCSGS